MCDFPGITLMRMKGDDEFGVGKNLQRFFHQNQAGQAPFSSGQEDENVKGTLVACAEMVSAEQTDRKGHVRGILQQEKNVSPAQETLREAQLKAEVGTTPLKQQQGTCALHHHPKRCC